MKIFLKLLTKLELNKRRLLGISLPKSLDSLDPDRISRIVTVSSTAIGDTFFTIPPLKILRELLPNAKIDLVVRDKVAPIFKKFKNKKDLFDNLLIYKGHYKNGLRLLRQFKKTQYHAAFIFHESDPCLTQISYLAKIPFIFRFGQKDHGVSRLLSTRIPYNEKGHAIDMRLEILRRVFGVKLESKDYFRMEFPIDEKEVLLFWSKIKEKFNKKDIDRKKLIGFQFSASGRYKEWPKENFVELGKRLISQGKEIVLIGGPKDIKRAKEIKKSIFNNTTVDSVLDLTGKVPLSDLPVLIKGLDLLVTNDTGPFHVAIAVGTPTVSLFVSTEITGTGPIQDLDIHRAIFKPKPCAPCKGKYCDTPNCMSLIKVDEVYRTSMETLNKNVRSF